MINIYLDSDFFLDQQPYHLAIIYFLQNFKKLSRTQDFIKLSNYQLHVLFSNLAIIIPRETVVPDLFQKYIFIALLVSKAHPVQVTRCIRSVFQQLLPPYAPGKIGSAHGRSSPKPPYFSDWTKISTRILKRIHLLTLIVCVIHQYSEHKLCCTIKSKNDFAVNKT